MSWKRDNPGCPCCSCTADSLHVCICSCLTPFSRTATVADGNGPHIITYNPTFNRWDTSYTSPFEVWRFAFVAGVCQDQGVNPNVCKSLGVQTSIINIFLTPNCTLNTWNLNFTWRVNLCDDPVTCAKNVRRPTGDTFISDPFFGLSIAIPMDCSNTSMLSFDFPTNHPTDGYPLPCGGGTFTAVFG